MGGSEPTPPTAGRALSWLAQGRGYRLGGWHILFFLLWPPPPPRGEPGPYSQGSCKVHPTEAALPLAGCLFGVIAVRVSTLRSGSRLVFGLFGLVRNFLCVFWFLF